MDRRQRKTRKAIFDAFEGLMAEEHYSQVTVSQIIGRADIGRSTFYKNDVFASFVQQAQHAEKGTKK